MRAISSKLNIYIKSIGVINNNIEKLVLNIILGSFGVLALLYVLFLGNMVKDIIERRVFEADARSLESEVQSLEVTYLAMSSNIDLNLSYSMGFKETKTTFTSRKSLGYVPTGASLDGVKNTPNDI